MGAAIHRTISDVDRQQSITARQVTNVEHDENSLPPKAVEIGRVFGFPITNSMLVSWMAALGLIIFAQLATRKMEQVPSGAQNFLEWLVESLYGFLEGILGPHLVKRTFWFFATVFILRAQRQLDRPCPGNRRPWLGSCHATGLRD